MDRKFITIGKIVNTQGNKGAVRILPLTDFPERFIGMKSVFVKTGDLRKEYSVEQSYLYRNFVVIKFHEIKNMNEAEIIKGSFLQVTREQLVPLPEGSYYIFDIVGLSVYTLEGEYLGEIKEVLRTGANDVYVVEHESKKPVLIPALKQVVKEIDLDGRCVKVNLPDGLI